MPSTASSSFVMRRALAWATRPTVSASHPPPAPLPLDRPLGTCYLEEAIILTHHVSEYKNGGVKKYTPYSIENRSCCVQCSAARAARGATHVAGSFPPHTPLVKSKTPIAFPYLTSWTMKQHRTPTGTIREDARQHINGKSCKHIRMLFCMLGIPVARTRTSGTL